MFLILLACTFCTLNIVTAAPQGMELSLMCPEGFRSARYKLSCYKFVVAKVNWFEAKEECYKSHESELASIESKEENQFITDHLRAHKSLHSPAIAKQLGFAHYWGYWISGNDNAQERVWKWLTTEPLGFSDWVPGEPNNLNGEHCLHLKQEMNWAWNDGHCKHHRMPFICEYKLLDQN